jgi:tetratricopeptide (TPR) repeat protein
MGRLLTDENDTTSNVSAAPKFLTIWRGEAEFSSHPRSNRNVWPARALDLHYNGETMTQHARKPALAALVLTLALGIAGLSATGALRSGTERSTDLATLERQIAGHPDADTWDAYGDALRAAGRYGQAADAYQRALKLDPARRATKINIGLALAQAKDADGFFQYVSRLTMTDAKVAVNLLEKSELAPLQGDPRFTMARTTAQGQAVD